MNTNTESGYNPQEELSTITASDGRMTLGILNNYPDSDETRLFLTPEACSMLATMGFRVLFESGAGIDINYSDEVYANDGAEILPRHEVLEADIVISVRPLTAADVQRMRKGAALISLMDAALFNSEVIHTLLERKVTMLALDNIVSANGVPIFSQILDEIDGRAAVLYAQEGLSFLGEGKGVLMGGIPGLQPCEVLVIGQGGRAWAAARAALSTGATVTMMDNDISSLAEAQAYCGDNLITSAINPKVLYNKVKSADVIMLDGCTRDFEFPKQLSVAMKDSVYLIDLESTTPSLSVPRTVAMALSNVLINFFGETLIKGGIDAQVASMPGVQNGVVTYRGRLTDKFIGLRLGMVAVDINILLTQAN